MTNDSHATRVIHAPARLPFMDHLRWGVILLVVTVHAAVTYSGIGSWYYHEPAELSVPSRVVFLAYEVHLQAFFMGLLFLVAGYFVPGAYDRKGPRRFLRDRLVRLGVPTAFYVLVIQPINVRMVLVHRNEPAPPFWPAYRDYLISGRVLAGTGPLWFALTLLIFTAIYAGIRRWRGGAPWKPAEDRLLRHADVGLWILTVTLVTFVVRVARPIGTDVCNLQLCFFPQYIALFIVGMMAYRGDWLLRAPAAFGILWLRLAVIVGPVLWVGVLASSGVWTGDYSRVTGGLHWQSALYCLWESLFCAGVCIGLVVLVRDRLNRHSSATQFLTDNAFAVYVFHAPILIALTLVLRALEWPPLAKFLLLSALGLTASLLLAHFVFRRLVGLRRIL